MRIVYIAGKLSGANNFDIARNIHAAEELGLRVAEAGAMPLIPHANTGMKFFGTLSEDFWYEGTLELLRRCDAVIMVSGYESSKGAMAEYEEALRLRLPRFFVVDGRIDSLVDWLRDGGPTSREKT